MQGRQLAFVSFITTVC
jgi:hypothetical protein